MDYTDGFPWLKWPRHFTGETNVRVKLIEPYNLLSTVLAVAPEKPPPKKSTESLPNKILGTLEVKL